MNKDIKKLIIPFVVLLGITIILVYLNNTLETNNNGVHEELNSLEELSSKLFN